MDRAKSKKIRNIRVIATNIFMSLSVVAIVFVLMLIAMGFTFNESGGLEQAGLVQLASNPSDATVKIDGETQFSHTELSKMLSNGVHSIKISKPGYGNWNKKLRIDAGLLTRVDWIRLFPKKPEISTAKRFNELRFATFSPNRKLLLAIEKDSNELLSIDIQPDKVKTTKIDLAECLSTTANKATEGDLTAIAWNNNNSRLIATWTHDNKTSWHLIDLEHSENSLNLTKKFNLDFSSILIANEAASKLWALENGNLRLIDTNELTISSAISSNIEKIAHNRDVVSFIHIDNEKRQLSIYKDGEKSYTPLAQLDKTTSKTTIKLAMGTHWNEDWLAYSVDSQIYVLGGKYPSYDRDKATSLKVKLERKLDYAPQLLSVNANQRIAVFADAKHLMSYDVETKDYFDTSFDNKISNINWLDSYLIWHNIDNKIVVRDFDGDNRREIVSNANSPLPTIVSENNKWLYYFNIAEQEIDDSSSTSEPSDATPSANHTTIKYLLKREKLQ